MVIAHPEGARSAGRRLPIGRSRSGVHSPNPREGDRPKGTTVHPLYSGEQARQRSVELRREAQYHRMRNHALERRKQQRLEARLSRQGRRRLRRLRLQGARQRLGLALIAAGMRFVDPDRAIRSEQGAAPLPRPLPR